MASNIKGFSMSIAECTACGSSFSDRSKYAEQNSEDDISVLLSLCPHCQQAKCCMCDMGDDVSCMNCEGDSE